MNQNIRESICDMGHDEAVVFDNPDFDDAIIGITDEGQVVYDYDDMVRTLSEQDHMTEEEAIEFIDYNTMRALPYAGEHAPIIMNRLAIDKTETDYTANRAIKCIEKLMNDTDHQITNDDMAKIIEILKGK